MVLRPLLLSRLAGGVLAVPAGYLAIEWVRRADSPGVSAGVVLLVAATGWLVVRAYRARVVCTDDAIVVHGYLRTRRVPRSAVLGLRGSVWPRLRWRTASGGLRSTLVSPLAAASVTAPGVAAHNERCLRRLADWVAEPGS